MRIVYNGLIYESGSEYDSIIREKFNKADASYYEGLLQKAVYDSLTKDVYYQFASVNKLGINPLSTYDTPNGVYCYAEKTLPSPMKAPFKSTSAKFLIFFEKEQNRQLTNSYTKEECEADLVKLRDMYGDETLNIAMKSLKRYFSYFEYIWKLVQKLSKNPNDWSSIFRKLGYDSAFDKGEGVIYPSEPTQCVFFNTTGFNILKVVDIKKKDHNTSTGEDYRFNFKNIAKEYLKLSSDIVKIPEARQYTVYRILKNYHNSLPENEQKYIANTTVPSFVLNTPKMYINDNQSEENVISLIETDQVDNRLLIEYISREYGISKCKAAAYIQSTYQDIGSSPNFRYVLIKDLYNKCPKEYGVDLGKNPNDDWDDGDDDDLDSDFDYASDDEIDELMSDYQD